MKFLNKYKRKYWLPFCIAVLFLTFEAVCDLLQPTIMSKIVDIGVANRDLNYVFKYGGLMLIITVIGALAASTRNILSSIVSQNFGSELRSDLFRKIQTLSFKSIDKFDRASLVTRLTNDVTQVQVFVNGLMRIFVKAPLLCVGGLIMATKLNIHLAVVLAVVVPIVAIIIIINMKVSFPFFIKVQKALDKINGMMREYLSGVRVVKAFNRFDFEENKFNQANEEFQEKSTSAIRLMAVFSPVIMLVVNLGIIAVLWIGGIRVEHGQLQPGTVIAFTNYMTQILFSLMMISMVFNMFIRAKASAGRIEEVFEEENDMTWIEKNLKTSKKGQIEFENVSFSYNGAAGDPVLKSLTFTCLPGETVGIIGSTGSGKSSLVNLIPRFYDATAGTIKVGGEDIKQIDPKYIRDKIAIVPQNTTLFSGTVNENIRWGKEDATKEEIKRAAQMSQAHDFIMESLEGYESRLGQGGVNFSGGQKQRLSIARALVKKPEILILDDSTSALDMVTESKLKDSLKKYASSLTCLLIAQRITSIMDADKIIVLDDGNIAGMGTHEQLLNTCKVYQEIYQSQMGKEVR
ncbi:ABC transporter ATP-binding protein [Heyndrickxia sporothermodurans]|nr:ABC transporter ATP-binding protein [Heyndrickxia sporothermodurans]